MYIYDSYAMKCSYYISYYNSMIIIMMTNVKKWAYSKLINNIIYRIILKIYPIPYYIGNI